MSNFKKYVELYPDEQLLKLYDKTILESGKEGVALTDKRLVTYAKNSQTSYYHEDLAHAKSVRIEPYFYRLFLVARSGEIHTIDLFFKNDVHLQQMLDVMKLYADDEIWKQAASQADDAIAQTGVDTTCDPIEIIRNAAEQPICPHCEQELLALHERRLTGLFRGQVVVYCPHCRKVLGFSQL